MFALYRHTRLCWFWKLEKRWYAQASPSAQAFVRRLHMALFSAVHLIWNRRTLRSIVAGYRSRGAWSFTRAFTIGWAAGRANLLPPIRSIVEMKEMGLYRVRAFPVGRTRTGLLGSGCDEYVYARR